MAMAPTGKRGNREPKGDGKGVSDCVKCDYDIGGATGQSDGKSKKGASDNGALTSNDNNDLGTAATGSGGDAGNIGGDGVNDGSGGDGGNDGGNDGTTSWTRIGVAVAGGTVAVAAAPLVLSLAGFTAAGVTGGSCAAWLMSLYGGSVPAAGFVAALQSVGAAGLGVTGTAVVGGAGAAVTDRVRNLLSKGNDEGSGNEGGDGTPKKEGVPENGQNEGKRENGGSRGKPGSEGDKGKSDENKGNLGNNGKKRNGTGNVKQQDESKRDVGKDVDEYHREKESKRGHPMEHDEFEELDELTHDSKEICPRK